MNESDSSCMFDSEDIDLLQAVIALHPQLEQAAYLTKLSLPYLNFPVESCELLAESLKSCELEWREERFGTREIRRFMKNCFFPISDKSDYLRKVFLACSIGHRYHFHEDEVRRCLSGAGEDDVVEFT